MMTGSETAETSEVWRAVKSLSAGCGSGSDLQVVPEKYHHGDLGQTPMGSGHLPCQLHLHGSVEGAHFSTQWQQDRLSSKLQVSHLPWSWEKPYVPAGWSMATSQMSLYQLGGANVPATNMDLRQIGFLYWAGAVDSTQHCPPVSPKCIPVVFHQHNWHWLYWEHKPAGNNRNNYIVLGNAGGCLLCFKREGSWLEKLSRLQKQRTLVAYALWLGKKRRKKKKKRNTRAGNNHLHPETSIKVQWVIHKSTFSKPK